MGLAEAKAHLARYGRDGDVIEFPASSATVDLAAERLGVEPGRIAKTLSFMTRDGPILIVLAGDARIDNAKYKARFACKASMLSADEVFEFTGHHIGGVCPFGLATPIAVWLDESLKKYDLVYPACGSDNSALACAVSELELLAEARGWVDVAKALNPEAAESAAGVGEGRS